MIRRSKPTVINLADLSERGAAGAEISRSSCQNNTMSHQPLHHSDNAQTNSFLTSEFDVEMKNDFKWLINFNLREILGCNIDEESSSNDSKVEKQMESHGKENLNKKDYRIQLLDIVEQCLQQKNGMTIREIFRWISTRYPCFKPKDCKWKNFVRKLLNKNSLFKNRKSENCRNNFWYLEKNCSAAESGQNYKEFKLKSAHGKSKEQRMHRQPKIKKEFAAKMAKRIINCYESCLDETTTYRPACDNIQTSALHQSSENWVDTTAAPQGKELMDIVKQGSSSEYFEMPVEFQVETVETTLEVENFLDEDTTSVTLELI